MSKCPKQYRRDLPNYDPDKELSLSIVIYPLAIVALVIFYFLTRYC